MSSDELKCCLCSSLFDLTSQPRMMPSCEHNACSTCLKKLIQDKTTFIIKCEHCGSQENLQEIDLEYFPKNISLTKALKQTSLNQISQEEAQKSLSSEAASVVSSTDNAQFCSAHSKEIQILCLTDKEKLCPHCALFGKHKNHVFKTISWVNSEMQQRRELFEQYCKRKEAIDSRISSQQFKDTLIRSIGEEKERVIAEIRGKFALFSENLRLAEKQAFQEVVKNFKNIYKKINALLKEQNDCQLRFREWQQRCKRLFKQAESKVSIEEKSALYFDGPLEECLEGQKIVSGIQQKIENNLTVIQKLISSIKITEDSSIANSVFNYLNVSAYIEDIDIMVQARQEVIQTKSFGDDSPKPKLEFSSAESLSLASVSSPWSPSSSSYYSPKRHSTPQKRSQSRQKNLNRTSERQVVGKSPSQQLTKNRNNVQKMVEQFCSRQNLDTLDLSSYSLSDTEVVDVLKYLKPIKRIKGLKLVKNNLTSEGLARIIELIPAVTNLNLSFNSLGDESLGVILSSRLQVPQLRIINISNNKINQRKAKPILDELKRQGVIVTI